MDRRKFEDQGAGSAGTPPATPSLRDPECRDGCRLGIEAGMGYLCTSGVCGLYRAEPTATRRAPYPRIRAKARTCAALAEQVGRVGGESGCMKDRVIRYPLGAWVAEPVPWKRRVTLALQSLLPWKYQLRAFTLTNPRQRVKGWIDKDGNWIVTTRTP